ncbi:MAG: HK97 family phage prohead protease [Actinobacteria bacterium]|nr:HK97 family phage prohead protease [Actinomycetota bacterium]
MNKSFAFAEVKALSTDDPNGEFEAILSAPTKDRDGEVVAAGAFDPLPDHITIDLDHELTARSTVGSGTPFYDGDLLKIRGTFASDPEAQVIRSRVAEGHIRTMSVAFMGAQKEPVAGTPTITKAELLNAAFVAVPSNREAAVLMAKDFKAGSRNSTSDAARLQQIHDMAVENGATCSAKSLSPSATNVTPDDDETTPVETDQAVTLSTESSEPEDAATAAATAAVVAADSEDGEELALRARALSMLAAT